MRRRSTSVQGRTGVNVSASRVSPISDWHPVPWEQDDGPASRAAIGLVTLCNDVTIEPELRNFLPRDGVAVCGSRVPMSNAGGIEALRALEDR